MHLFGWFGSSSVRPGSVWAEGVADSLFSGIVLLFRYGYYIFESWDGRAGLRSDAVHFPLLAGYGDWMGKSGCFPFPNKGT
jgi:hypothetical protein